MSAGYTLRTVAFVALLLTGGCLAVQDRYEATPVTVSEDALGETGYAGAGSDTITRTRTDVRGAEGNVTVVSYTRSYARNVTGPGGEARPLAAVVTVSTPSVTVANREFNPVADWAAERLVREFRSRLEDRIDGQVRDVSRVGTRQAAVLGAETTFTQFRALTTVEGQEVPLLIEVAKRQDGEDFVVVFTVSPAETADAERSRLRTVLAGLEHPTEG